MRGRIASMTRLVLTLLVALGGLAPPAAAAPGDLDEDFGFFGVTIAPFSTR
jgi:hypothetical protein